MVSFDFWENVVKEHRVIELSNERVSSDVSHGYQFDVESISTHSSLSNPSIYNVKHEIRLSLFDAFYRRFIGQTWHSEPVSSKVEMTPQPSRIAIKQPVYFHTTVLDSSLLMVVEVVLVLTPKDPLLNQPNQVKKQSAGWCIMRLFATGQTLKSTNEKRDSEIKKLDLFQGSPRALLFAEDPIEKNADIKLVPSCQVFVHFLKHQPLEKVAHLIPENRLIGADHRIPGVLDHYVMNQEGKDFYMKAKPIDPSPCFIDFLSINLGQPLDKFEEKLCYMLNMDRLLKLQIPDDGRMVTVTARGLRVGVHNGYGYVKKPHFVHVEPGGGDSGNRPTNIQRMGRTATVAHSDDELILRSRLQLDEMINDTGVVICFHLEYSFSLPTANLIPAGSRTSLFNQSQTVMLRWTWWPPTDTLLDQTVTCQLKGGSTLNPYKEFLYQLEEDSDIEANPGFIRFDFLTSGQSIVPASANNTKTTSFNVPKSPSFLKKMSSLLRPSKPSMLRETQPDPVRVYEQGTQHPSSQSTVNLEVSHLESEEYTSPVYAHPIVPISKNKDSSLSRALQARIYASHVPDIVDRNGSPPHLVDPSDPSFKVNLPLNITDPLQFYRFQPVATQRVALVKQPSSDGYRGNRHACILRKIEAGEKIDEGPAGLGLIYHIDPVDLRRGENSVLMTYLSTHRLFIDVWDGDTLMLLGSVCLPLQHLLRNRKDCVCVDHQLDVFLSEHSDVAPTFTGDLSTSGRVRPLGLQALHRGRLFLRIANVGFPSSCKAPSTWTRSSLVVADLSGRSFYGGSLSSPHHGSNELESPHLSLIRRLPECDLKLAQILLVNKESPDADKNGQTILSGEERSRKLSRMKYLRSIESSDPKRVTVGRKAMLDRHERMLKERDLLTIDEYRERTKGDRILDVLTLAITTHHTIRATLGVAEYVELELRNPFATPQTVTVECSSPDLRIVGETREWKHFKKLSGLSTPLEEDMFAYNEDNSLPQIYLRPKETVYIPFRYQSFYADNSVVVQGPSHCKTAPTALQPITWDYTRHEPNKVKAVLKTLDGRPFSILQLNILLQPPVIAQTLRFYSPEQAFLKKCVRLPPHGALSNEQFHALCSDPDIVCQAVSRGHDEPREIYLKASCGESPSIRKFYLCLYNDAFLITPIQTWLIYVHALQRVDVECVMGQTSRFTIALRGTQSARKVQCFPSHPQEMQVSPKEGFLLPSNGVSEVHVGVRTTAPHKSARHMYINVVDIEYHQLVRTWLVATRTREPMISKEFAIELPRSGSRGNAKMISYTNPYPSRKHFRLLTNRADLLQFRENSIELMPGEKTTFGLRFATGVAALGEFPVYVFINNDDDKNEETFLIKVTYR